jgi:hypothetical protein
MPLQIGVFFGTLHTREHCRDMIRRNIFCEKREREDDVKRGAQRGSPYCEHCRIF